MPMEFGIDRPLRVIVSEDDSLIRMTMAALLSDRGHAVVEAATASAALAALAEPADLLITDLNLPDMDGEALVRAARARAPSLRTLVVTGESGRTGNHSTWLLKPFTSGQLDAAIKTALGAE